MYRAIIYASDGTTKRTAFLQAEMRELDYTTEVNKAGSASFKIDANSVKATAVNLALFNRIKIYQDETPKFIGFIEEIQAGLNEVEIRCIGLLGLLARRRFSQVLNNVLVTDFVTDMVTDLNATVNLNITEGTNDSVSTISKLEITRTTALDALTRIASSYELEFNIDENQALNVTSQLGTDKSSIISFQYVKSRIEMATVYDFDVTVSGKDMTNKVYGYSRNSGGFTSVTGDYEDATSIAVYGLLEEDVNMSPATTAQQLTDDMTGYVEERKDEFYTPVVTPNPDKIDENAYDVGDTVNTLFDNGFIQFSGNYRIVKKTVTVGEDGVARPRLGLRPEGKNLLPSRFIDDIIKIDKRIGRLEQTL